MNLDSEDFVKYLVDNNIYEHMQKAYEYLAINQPADPITALKQYFISLDSQTRSKSAVDPLLTKRIILLGAPGSGKTTQSKLLSKHYGVCNISPSELIAAETARRPASAGPLKDTEILQLVIQKINSKECQERGYVLDGFPETEIQARALKTTQTGNRMPTDIIEIVCPEEVAKRRVASGAIEEQVLTKFKLFNIHFSGVKKVFMDMLTVIDGQGDVETVFNRTNETLKVPHRTLYGAEVLPRGPSILPKHEQKLDFAMAHTFNTKSVVEEI